MLRNGANPGGAPAGVLGMLVQMATELEVFGIALSKALLACKRVQICLAATLEAALLLTALKPAPCVLRSRVFPGR